MQMTPRGKFGAVVVAVLSLFAASFALVSQSSTTAAPVALACTGGFSGYVQSIPGLTHYYPLTDATTVNDQVGTVNATNINGVQFTPNGAVFNGTNFLRLADNDDFSLKAQASKGFTVMAFQSVSDWAEGTRAQNEDGYVHWMGKGHGYGTTGQQEWLMRHYFSPIGSGEAGREKRHSFYHFNPAGGLGTGSYFQDNDPVGYEKVVVAEADLTTTSGVTGAGSNSPGATFMWKNGVLRDSDGFQSGGGGTNIRPQNTTSPVEIGSVDGDSFFKGTIRRVAFFDRKLTAAEIKGLYDNRALAEGTCDGSTATPTSPAPTQPTETSNPTSPTSVTIDGSSKALEGVNIARGTDDLILYRDRATTGTNQYGFEAAVRDGKVLTVRDGVGNMAVPVGGYVLSGHGTSRSWLRTHAQVGDTVTLNGLTSPSPTEPTPTEPTPTEPTPTGCQ